jgi:hypothetical protein
MSALATTSAASFAAVPSILAIPISEKLTKANRSAQVLSTIHATQLDDLLTGVDMQSEKELTMIIDDKPVKSRNPAYSMWVARDQAVLGYLLSTLTHETLQHVSRCSTSAHAWCTLVDLYSS